MSELYIAAENAQARLKQADRANLPFSAAVHVGTAAVWALLGVAEALIEVATAIRARERAS